MLEFNATFIVAMFSFIVFILMMNAILYKPLSRIQKERADIVAREYDEAKAADERTECLKEQQKRGREMSKLLAKENFNKKIYEYKLIKDAIVDNAKNSAKKDLAISNAKLDGDRREAKVLLKPTVKELAKLISSKVLGYETEIGDCDQVTK